MFVTVSVSSEINIICRHQPDKLWDHCVSLANDPAKQCRRAVRKRNVDQYSGRTAINLVQIFYQCGLIRNNARNCSFIRAISHILISAAGCALFYCDAYVKKYPGIHPPVKAQHRRQRAGLRHACTQLFAAGFWANARAV